MCSWYFVCLCVAASGIISMFFKERAAASEKVLTTASEGYLKDLLRKENVQLLFRSGHHLRNILK